MKTDKDHFIKRMSNLFDICDEFNIEIVVRGGKRPPPVGRQPILEAKLTELRDARTIPFDIPVVSARDIHQMPEFKGHSKRAIAGALRVIGCIYISQGFETPSGKTTLWCAWDYDRISIAAKKTLCAIYNREEDWPEAT